MIKKKKRERENKKCDKEGRKTRMAAHKWEKKKVIKERIMARLD